MIDRTVAVHGCLAVAASVAAYVAWRTPDASGKPEPTVVVAGSAERLQAIDWHEPRYDVRVERTEGGHAVAVRVTKEPAADATDSARAPQRADTGAAAQSQIFPGSDQASELFAKLAPLKAARALGEVSAAELEKFELDEPSTRLTLTFPDQRVEIGLGKSTYGTGDLYARGPDGRVFLLPSKAVSQLRYGASALLDRRLVGLERAAIERASVERGETRRALVHRDGDQPDKAFFAEPAEPEVKLERLSNLVDRVLRLRVNDFADGAPPATEPALVVRFERADETLAQVRLWAADDAGATAVTSRFTRPVRLSRAAVDQILRDLDDVLAEGL